MIFKSTGFLIILLIAVAGFTVFQLLSGKKNFQANQVLVPVTSAPLTEKIPPCTDHNPDAWHPAVKKDSAGNLICAYGHEHGDPPPEWVTGAGFKVGFDEPGGFSANTSELENTQKHTAMKGFEATIKGVQIYLRIHLASNPLDRTSRYHSYELFLKDQTGGISHFQGWLNTGDPVKDRIPYQDSTAGEKGKDPGTRPIVWASTRQACKMDKTWCIELWTMTTSAWGPDISWGINDATTFYKPGETYDKETAHWDKSGSLGGDRSVTLTILRDPESLNKRGVNQIPVGKIWATQFGDIVTGPTDPRCLQQSIKFGERYKNICLENFISPTLPEITGAGNTAQKIFDTTGVTLPN